MRKMKRAVIIREVLVAKRDKISLRIQKLSEQAYEYTKMIEQIDAIPPQKPFVKAEQPAEAPVETPPVSEEIVAAPEAPSAIS